jgi:large subunit ribosomal protein L17
MPTPTKGPRLGGSPAHERQILANLAMALFKHGKITTTETKAKRVRPLAERLITQARRDDLASRRRVRRIVQEREVFTQLFEEIAPRYVNRPGGYTRIVKLNPRKGDNAAMAQIELITEELIATTTTRNTRPAARKATRAEAVAALAGDDEDSTPVASATEAEPADADAAEDDKS